MFVDRFFVGEDFLFFLAVRDAHDVDVAKLRAALTPVGVGHDVVAADLLAGLPLDEFILLARGLSSRGIIGRFSTFLEHVKPNTAGERVTKFNALFHWAVPKGREMDAGRQVGRFHIMTHAYWREGGTEFGDVNVMGVAHGTDKQLVLAHKAAIDKHLAAVGIPAGYTNVFWGGRSEIKPSEIAPRAYAAWCESRGIDPAAMR